ncbi:MAG: hypothetical protein LBE35_02605 [Clostridiales bacterium]|jgi:hypothetical protein|nr:hypothetical protein [Clostridiales bacterium]
MMRNVFTKSAGRRPLRSLILVLLVFVAAFAFVARATEYNIIRNELNRMESTYRSIGFLSPIFPENISRDMDAAQAAEIVAASPFVAWEDRRVFVQGILGDRTNVTAQIGGFRDPDAFVPIFEGLEIESVIHYFHAIPAPAPVRMMGAMGLNLYLYVDELIVGDPGAMRYEATYLEAVAGVGVTLTNRRSVFVDLSPQEAELFNQGLFDPFYGMNYGGRYLFRGVPMGQGVILLPLMADENGLGIYFALAGDNAFLSQIQTSIDLARDNMHSLMIIGSRDMTAMARFQDPFASRLVRGEAGGRWLNEEDYINQNPVAVVTAQMAARKNLRVGETFSITLRENPRPAWIDQAADSPWNLGIEGWWEPVVQGWWATVEYHENWRDRPSYELTLEVVGVYWNLPTDRPMHNFSHKEIYIPASLIPSGFGWDNAPMLTSMYSFMLDSPRNEAAFITENVIHLQNLGFRPAFLDNGFAEFAAFADPLRISITSNLVLFSIAAALVLILVVFLFIREWQKTVAIARALGDCANKTLARLVIPTVSLWIPAIILGSAAAWFFAHGQAEATLGELEGLIYQGHSIHLDASLLIFWTLSIILVISAGLVISVMTLARKPVLMQLQGVSRKRRRKKRLILDSHNMTENFSFDIANISSNLPQISQAAKAKAAFRHIFRHIFRAPAKSALILVVALFFIVALGWIDHTIISTQQEIDDLWDNTVVIAELVTEPNDSMVLAAEAALAPLGRVPISRLADSDFAASYYIEALWNMGFLRHEQNPVNFAELPMPWSAHVDLMMTIGIHNLYDFIQENTRIDADDALGIIGENIEISFAQGYGMNDFIYAEARGFVPILVRSSFLDEHGYEPGEALVLEGLPGRNMQASTPQIPVKIIGAFDHGLSRAVNRTGLSQNVIIMPLTALEHYVEELPYMTARFYLNPYHNRELAYIQDIMGETLVRNRAAGAIPVPLELIVHDHVLRNLVEPMEQNLVLLRLLYPITIAVAAVISVTLALLIVLQNVKNATIMRTLGKTKAKTRLLLCAEYVLPSTFGTFLASVVLLMVISAPESTPLAPAALFLAGSLAGSILGAHIISTKTPLELLQARE